MESQYRKIKEFNDTLWTPDSPVLVDKMRLMHDRIYGTNVLQITFRNVTDMNIYGLSIILTLKDANGRQIYEEIPFNYYGMEAQRGRCFGAGDDIIVEPEAMDFEITVILADLEDGQHYRGAAKLKKLPAEQSTEMIGEFEDAFKVRLTQLRPKVKILCAPEKHEQYWRCVCRRVYPNSFDKCTFCRIGAEELLNIIPDLKKEKRQRELEAERLEQERLEEEERRRQEEEKRREEERLRREQEEKERLEREKEEKLRREKQKKKIITIAASVVCAAAIAVGLIKFLPRTPPEEPQPPEETAVTPTPEAEKTVDVVFVPKDISDTEENDGLMRLEKPVVILGADLAYEETRTIWRLFSTEEEKLGEHDTVTITAEESHLFMDVILGSGVVEDRALSSMLITPAKKGSGVHLLMYNIYDCGEQEFMNAFDEMGLTDVEVIVAAPARASGASALAGFYSFVGGSDKFVGQGIGTAKARTVMNIRTGDSTDFARYGSVSAGTEVEVLEILDNGWMKIVWQYAPCGYAYTCNTNDTYYTYTPNAPAEE